MISGLFLSTLLLFVRLGGSLSRSATLTSVSEVRRIRKASERGRLPDSIVHYDGGNGGAQKVEGNHAASNSDADVEGPSDWPIFSPPEDGSKKGQQVPYGKKIPRQKNVDYYVASGVQECNLCKQIIAEAEYTGRQYFDACGYLIRANLNKEMCSAQQRTLQSCPEFLNDWCYHDLGGTQQLLSPCPAALKCHYCLGLNPLHCL